MTHHDGELLHLRGEMDRVNEQLLELFVRRMELARRIGRIKEEAGLPIRDPAREEAILEEMGRAAGPDLEGYARRLFRLLMEMAREHEEAGGLR